MGNVNPGLINPKRLVNWGGTIYDHWRSTPLINKPWFINPGLTLPVVPARGGVEVALGIYYKTFLSMRRAPARPVRACILRKWCPVSPVTFEARLRTSHFSLHSSHSTLRTSHSTLHTSHCTLRTPHFTSHCALKTPHFTFHTSHSSLLSSICRKLMTI